MRIHLSNLKMQEQLIQALELAQCRFSQNRHVCQLFRRTIFKNETVRVSKIPEKFVDHLIYGTYLPDCFVLEPESVKHFIDHWKMNQDCVVREQKCHVCSYISVKTGVTWINYQPQT